MKYLIIVGLFFILHLDCCQKNPVNAENTIEQGSDVMSDGCTLEPMKVTTGTGTIEP